MKAIVFSEYGSPDVLQLADIDVPTIKDNEVLVRVVAGGCNAADWRLMRADPHLVRLSDGLRRPRKLAVIGSDMAGRVEAVGAAVTRFAPGDEVYGACERGGFAEYVAMAETKLARKPANLSFEQAAVVPMAAATALQGLRDKGRLVAGQHVLINGAAGGVGTFAVQIAAAMGAEVTGVCSTRNVEMVRSLGAHHVIDYTKDDYTAGDRRYDLMLDIVSSRPLSESRRVLTRKGTFVAVGGGGGRLLGPASSSLKALLLGPFVSQRMTALMATAKTEVLDEIRDLVEGGKVTPVIERTYPLAEVADAIRHLEEGHVRGKLAITI